MLIKVCVAAHARSSWNSHKGSLKASPLRRSSKFTSATARVRHRTNPDHFKAGPAPPLLYDFRKSLRMSGYSGWCGTSSCCSTRSGWRDGQTPLWSRAETRKTTSVNCVARNKSLFFHWSDESNPCRTSSRRRHLADRATGPSAQLAPLGDGAER